MPLARIELDSVGTGFALVEIILGLEGKLADKVVARVRAEIERRMFELSCAGVAPWTRSGFER